MRSLPIDVTAGPRADILHCVQGLPGIHLRRIEREVSLPLGQVLYHLERLERMGLLVSARDSGFRRYFPAGEVARAEKPVLSALRQEPARRILLGLLRAGPCTHKEIQARVGSAASTLSFHLQRLVASGVLVRERLGTANLYSLADPATTRRELILYRESFRDPEVDRYVREELSRLPAVGAVSVTPGLGADANAGAGAVSLVPS